MEADLSFVQRMEIYVLGDDGLILPARSYERDVDLRNPAIFLMIHEDVNLLGHGGWIEVLHLPSG